ncbi:MAG: Gfo/Idh/MocA family oxidoreductase [Verrucomicrobiota bacterium]|nr:Gfo/Idh/MocA family oxidoreductase [Verrucomicrobiota bacterium]
MSDATFLSKQVSRRKFSRDATVATIGTIVYGAIKSNSLAQPASEKLRVAVMGLGRGMDLAQAALALPNTEITFLCDIDDERIARGQKILESKFSRKPKGEKDIRQVLESSEVDALFIAAPNHWHAPASIMACAAGKHVYVEKPCSHNPWEGEMMVKAARKHGRHVQMGNQRRSWPAVIEAMQRIREGAIGPVRYARCWYNNARTSIGRGRQIPVPANIDYSLWQGPAPERPYLDNLVHYNWHWRWHWGNAELGNNGIHALDLARWGLGVEYPTRVSCHGGRYHFSDDQETPDTTVASFDFGGKGATWDGSSCHPRETEKLPFITFYGDSGSLSIIGSGYRIDDLKGKETARGNGEGGEKIHIANFFDAIRKGNPLTSEILEGHKSTLLCHLGNIAWRTHSSLEMDPKTGWILKHKEASKLWKREYRAGWEPKV